MDRKEEIRNKLSEFVDCDYGKKLREELNLISKNEYIKKHSDNEYIKFIEENSERFSVEVNGYQSRNEPYYLDMFTIRTQHVLGDSIYECIDKAMEEK